MAGLKELRTRIESIKSTQKITSAMKMVAASKFRRAQLTLEKSELFQKMMIGNIKNVLVSLKQEAAEKGVKTVWRCGDRFDFRLEAYERRRG